QVALVRHLANDVGILVIVEVMPIGVENAVAAQPIRLVNLKIKTNRSHGASAFYRVRSRMRDGRQLLHRLVHRSCEVAAKTYVRRWITHSAPVEIPQRFCWHRVIFASPSDMKVFGGRGKGSDILRSAPSGMIA